MRSAATEKKAPGVGPIGEAIAASAKSLPPHKSGELESALMDAAMFSELAYGAFCNLGFENREPPKLSEDESSLVYWTVNQLGFLIGKARTIFYDKGEGSL